MLNSLKREHFEVTMTDRKEYLTAYLLYPSVAPELRLIRIQNHFVHTGVVNPDLHAEERFNRVKGSKVW